MTFFIITPSFNQLDYLKRCIASVRDQVAPEARKSEVGDQRSEVGLSALASATAGGQPSSLEAAPSHGMSEAPDLRSPTSDLRSLTSEGGAPLRVHHHIQDGGSTDGTVEFLREFDAEAGGRRPEIRGQRSDVCPAYTFSYSSEPDAGMYDALNKGIEKRAVSCQLSATQDSPNNQQPSFNNCDNEIVAWLNCDEQYLPGALQKVAHFFKKSPVVDLVYGDALLVDAHGQLLTYRKNPPLRKAYILADHLYTQSASMFFRAGVFESGLRFDTAWKAVGDCDLVIRALDAGFRAGPLRDYLAACAMTGENLSCLSDGVEELKQFRRQVPGLYRLGRALWNGFRYAEKLIRGGYRQSVPFNYALYVNDTAQREILTALSASSRFKWSEDEA